MAHNFPADFLHENASKLEDIESKQQQTYGTQSDVSVVVGQPQSGATDTDALVSVNGFPDNGNEICFAILVGLLCSLPIGVVALVFASKKILLMSFKFKLRTPKAKLSM